MESGDERGDGESPTVKMERRKRGDSEGKNKPKASTGKEFVYLEAFLFSHHTQITRSLMQDINIEPPLLEENKAVDQGVTVSGGCCLQRRFRLCTVQGTLKSHKGVKRL